jgi:hypothetical protein
MATIFGKFVEFNRGFKVQFSRNQTCNFQNSSYLMKNGLIVWFQTVKTNHATATPAGYVSNSGY